MKAFFVSVLFLLAMPAFAQEQQLSPSQVVLQIDSVLHAWAQQLEAQDAAIKNLRAQVKRLTDESAAKKEPQE